MKKHPDWAEFEYKYPTEAERRERFEDMARCLFCHRFGMPYGIFQCINHVGNETEVVEIGDSKIGDRREVVGFQAKYFKKEIDKDNIIDSLRKARRENPTQTKQIIYTNIGIGKPPKAKKPQYQIDIENEAQSLQMEVEWATDKMILQQVLPLPWVQDIFFNIDSDYESIDAYERRHTEECLAPIESAITYQDQTIKVSRETILTGLAEGIREHKHYVIHGEGGCGKTAIIKNLSRVLAEEKIPICIRKAQELNVTDADTLFNNYHTIEQFLELYHDAPYKVFVIDSAERMQEIEDTDPLYSLLKRLSADGWSILFTVRDVYLKDLEDDLKMVYRIPTETISINTITEEELERNAKVLGVLLPKNNDFKQRLCNLFYLRFYLEDYADIQQDDSYQTFIQHVWKRKVQGGHNRKGLGIARENCFLKVVRDRMDRGDFYLEASHYDSESLQALVVDEIIGQAENGIFITHDIYEEWGVSKIIDQEWSRKADIRSFFDVLGTSYVTLRTFRQWMSDKLNKNQIGEVQAILQTVNDKSILPIWRDEIIVSILQSSYSDTFFAESEQLLLANESELLIRIAYLLRVACKRVSTVQPEGMGTPMYIPDERGWEVMIRYMYEHREKDMCIPNRWQILTEWCMNNLQGEVTREAGLLALWVMNKREHSSVSHYYREAKTLYNIVAFAAGELKEELTLVLNEIANKRWYKNHDPYYNFSLYLLSGNLNTCLVVKHYPQAILRIAELMWMCEKRESGDDFGYYELHQENRFGLRRQDHLHDYSPAGAYQTPIYWLLCVAPIETVAFIVRLVNHCVQAYVQNGERYNHDDMKQVKLRMADGTEVTQWGSYWSWGIYRGAIHLVVPDLLQSVHMGLEQYLLKAIKDRPENVNPICDYLLRNSQSVSLTAVVSSVVMAYPERYHQWALVLFSALELFHYDSIRLQDESSRRWEMGMGAVLNRAVAQERIQSLELPHRKESLEGVCTRYQYVRTELSEEESQKLLQEIRRVLDEHWETVKQQNGENTDTRQILLYRLDRRTHRPKIVEGGDENQVLFELCPQMPSDLRERSDEFIAQSKSSMRFSAIHVWAYKRLRHEDTSAYTEYEQDIPKVMAMLRDLLNALKKRGDLMPMSEWTPYAVAGVLVRDYYGALTEDDRELCVQLVEESVGRLLEKSYRPMIDDGVESCVHALTELIRQGTDDAEVYWKVLLRVLYDDEPIGQYKRVCDYAVEAIHEGKLWETHPKECRALLQQYKDGAKSMGSRIGLETDMAITDMVMSLIPSDTTDENLEQEVLAQLPVLRKVLFEKPDHVYYRMTNFFMTFAHFLLHRSADGVAKYVNPLLEAISANREWQYFLMAILSAENMLRRKETFWKLWELFYPRIVSSEYGYADEVIATYLLASHMPLDESGHWHSFEAQNKWIYAKTAKDIGHLPIVLYCIARALNEVASDYMRDGLEWVYTVVHAHPEMVIADQPDTILYLERAFYGYVLQHRKEIRRDREQRNKIMEILTFMAERESVLAYKLRERV